MKCISASIVHDPFGMITSGRNWTAGSSDGYRFGFNGHQIDKEIMGQGNAYDFGLRCYNSRIGRMFSMDPRMKEYPWQTPFAYHRNNPIASIDYLGGGDPPAAEQITKLIDRSNQEIAVRDELKCQGENKLIEGIALLDQASALLEGNYSDEDFLKALDLSEQAGKIFTEGYGLLQQAAEHGEIGENLYQQALGLVPKMMEEYYSELDRLEEWGEDVKTQIVIDKVTSVLGINGLIGVGTIEIFGPTQSKTPAMGSYPGTSRWSKYVASKYPMKTSSRIPMTGGTSITRSIGRVAVPLMLIWQGFDTAESIHSLYQNYTDGPSEEEIQFWLDDFEQWKLENPE